jgi:hypothetical protein
MHWICGWSVVWKRRNWLSVCYEGYWSAVLHTCPHYFSHGECNAYIFKFHHTGGRLTHYCPTTQTTEFCFQYKYKERINQKVRKFAMFSLSFSPQYDFSVNGDGLQIQKVAADSWQEGRPQVWGLGKAWNSFKDAACYKMLHRSWTWMDSLGQPMQQKIYMRFKT